jgi:hypothetical protein
MISWKILEVFAKENVITHVKYFVSLSDDKNKVESEGYWYFDCPTAKVVEELRAEIAALKAK